MLLKMSMGGLRIDNHWGSGGGQRPVIQLIKEVNDIDQTGEEESVSVNIALNIMDAAVQDENKL